MTSADLAAPEGAVRTPELASAGPLRDPGRGRTAATSGRRAASHRRRLRTRTRRVALALLALLLLALVWLGMRAYQLASVLTDAAGTARSLEEAAADADAASASALVPVLQAQTARAAALSGDAVWAFAELLPVVGDDARAVALVAQTLDDVARDTLEPLADVAGVVSADALHPEDGALDLAPITGAAPDLRIAAIAARESADVVAGIELTHLVPPLAEQLGPLVGGLDELATAVEGMADLAAVLPPMLGDQGPRTYLVLAMNSAELRNGGGLVGSVLELRADEGRLRLLSQRSAGDFPQPGTPVLPLDDEEAAVHSDRLGTFVQNVTETPDFPRTAVLAGEFWRLATGDEVDGVLAVDPTTLAYLLEVVGPLEAPDGTALDSTSLVDLLLSRTYDRFSDPGEADDFFGAAARTAFEALTEGELDMAAVAGGVRRAVAEDRVHLWSADPGEQRIIAGSNLGGAFFDEPAEVAAGVFLSDRTEGKMSYYLRRELSVSDVTCAEDRAVVTLELVLHSTAPVTAHELPRYVTGTGATGVPAGNVRTAVTVYAPVGAAIGELSRRAEGGRGVIGVDLERQAGREVRTFTSELAPGERVVFDLELVVEAGTRSLTVRSTPTLDSTGGVTVPISCQSAP